MSAPHIPQAGDIVGGKYILDRLLGKGGFGIVFEAKHAELPRRAAIKFLLERQLNNSEERNRFNREADIGSLLQTGHNVDVSDKGEFVRWPNAPGIPYIVMEYLEGKDLNAHVGSEGPLPVHTAVDYILQACIALAEAHGRGIFHRDIKPANLFLLTSHRGAQIIKVLDFGLAKTNETHDGIPTTRSGIIIASVGYASPEQQQALNLANGLSDIFSLGASLYFLLTGRRAFAGATTNDIFVAVARDAPMPIAQFRQDVPQGLVDVIERALEKKPVDRPQSIVEFAWLLVPFGSDEAIGLFEEVEQAAALGACAALKVPIDGGTIKLDDSHLAPSVDSITIPRHPPQLAPVPPRVATPTLPTPSPAAATPTPALPTEELFLRPRQTNWLIVALALVALTVPIMGIGFWMSRSVPAPTPVPSASIMKESLPMASIAPSSNSPVVPTGPTNVPQSTASSSATAVTTTSATMTEPTAPVKSKKNTKLMDEEIRIR
jgi:eukaryotic-like serine/threonine-protein kinase